MTRPARTGRSLLPALGVIGSLSMVALAAIFGGLAEASQKVIRDRLAHEPSGDVTSGEAFWMGPVAAFALLLIILVLLLVIGRISPGRITTFKRTMTYNESDFRRLCDVVSKFERIVTTPNIATEIDNLSRQLPRQEHLNLSAAMRMTFAGLAETHFPTRALLDYGHYTRFGLADTHSILLATECLLLTDDLPLYGYAASTGRAVINFNHLRLDPRTQS